MHDEHKLVPCDTTHNLIEGSYDRGVGPSYAATATSYETECFSNFYGKTHRDLTKIPDFKYMQIPHTFIIILKRSYGNNVRIYWVTRIKHLVFFSE